MISNIRTSLKHYKLGTQILHAFSRMTLYTALVYDSPGPPEAVLQLRNLESPGALSEEEVRVKFLKAPINPSDINTIEGKYPLAPNLPGGVPGHEGVGEIIEVGSQVKNMRVGDWVVPTAPCCGTWRQEVVLPSRNLFSLPPNCIPLEAAATLCINPPSALAMLEDFVQLCPGDVIIQNGATSAVGKIVIQLARNMGVKTVNIIRPRAHWDETVAELKLLGADIITTEARAHEDVKAHGIPPAVLGLNCVGGSSVVAVAKLLRDGGTVVTYGGMSMQPVNIPTSLLIFKNISFRGFWLSGSSEGKKLTALSKLIALIQEGALKPGPTKSFKIGQVKEALEYYKTEHRPSKVLLNMQ
ncbi:hypothetical protein CEUSTIGMA_g4787.t1 [Chlamydomonas eustigma]|uniref:enoyl-[acyl-carrier-protein] reductase n=1 Tax=Chlamydomonas eustigma TaxID=1157962 RepID=A0A250X2P6_9CHLO|nr:hypothetical protein CEUSTIGMA_g4787.t1 [Chlamydomonas eustigma]|eukprot:GAX77341.1 hypothetical protein CEUSTIGMA_g4787.t1 [Chlamydomonas eustigma]